MYIFLCFLIVFGITSLNANSIKVIDDFERWELNYYAGVYPLNNNYVNVSISSETSVSGKCAVKIAYTLSGQWDCADFLNSLSYSVDWSDTEELKVSIKRQNNFNERFWFIVQDEDGDMFRRVFDVAQSTGWLTLTALPQEFEFHYSQTGNGILDWSKIKKYQFRIDNTRTSQISSTVYLDFFIRKTKVLDTLTPQVIAVFPYQTSVEFTTQPICVMLSDLESDIDPNSIKVYLNNVEFSINRTPNNVLWNSPVFVVYPVDVLNFLYGKVVSEVYASDLTGKNVSFSWNFYVSETPVYKKTITGTFIQPSNNIYWSLQNWREYFNYMKQIGIDTVIIQWTMDAHNNYAYYPSNVYNRIAENFVSNILQVAAENSIDVFLGLRFNEPRWEQWGWPPPYSAVESFMLNEIQHNKTVIDELWQLYSGSSSFKGWYIVYEIEDLHWNTKNFQDLIKNFLKEISNYCKIKSPAKKVMISPYFGKNIPYDLYQKWWEYVLEDNHIDIVALQDGVGCKRVDIYKDVLPYFWALKNACEKNNVSFWANVETFEQIHGWPVDNQPWQAVSADINRIKQQIKIVEDLAEKIIQFEFSYMSPFNTHTTKLYQDYLSFYNSLISTSSVLPPRNLRLVSVSSSTVNIEWDIVLGIDSYVVERSTDNINFVFVSSMVYNHFVDINLLPDTTYYYRIFSLKEGKRSSYSEVLKVTTLSSFHLYVLSININPPNAGSVIKNPDKAGYTAGEVVTLTATANSGYEFVGWSGDLGGVSNPTTIVMNSNKTVTANFVSNTIYDEVNKKGYVGVSDIIVITPNNDGKSDRINFSVDEKNGKMLDVEWVRIYDLMKGLIKEIKEPPYEWNGKDKSGKEVKMGIYTYELKKKNNRLTKGRILILR